MPVFPGCHYPIFLPNHSNPEVNHGMSRLWDNLGSSRIGVDSANPQGRGLAELNNIAASASSLTDVVTTPLYM